jgi:2Fe-2S iron-sulfur cluster binding domain
LSDNPSRPNPAEIDVAAEAGVYVPTLCYLKDRPALGTCRACVVNVDGRAVPACTVTISDRMRVEVNEPETTDMRQALVETLSPKAITTAPFARRAADPSGAEAMLVCVSSRHSMVRVATSRRGTAGVAGRTAGLE